MIHDLYVEVEPVILKFVVKGVHVFYFCGGRGIGKTYGALDLCRKLAQGEIKFDSRTSGAEKFLYLRRTSIEAQTIAKPESCPFKKYNAKEGYEINADFSQKLGFGNFYMDSEQTQKIGICAGLSTFSNLRGVDFSEITFILYDECLPENKNKTVLKNEGFLLLDMLETINRNRIMEGLGEVVLCMLSNPIDLASDFLSQLEITPILNTMIFKQQEKYTSYERSLHIEKYIDHKVSKEKEQSFLYKFAKPTGYNERSLSGDFVDNDLTLIKKVDLKDYRPFLTLENICVYEHKSDTSICHISQTMMPARYTFRVYEREKFREVFYWRYKLLVVERRVTYDNFATKTVFESMIKFKPL